MNYSEKVALLAQEIVIVLTDLRKKNQPLTSGVVRGALARRPHIRELLFSTNHNDAFTPSVESDTSKEAPSQIGISTPSPERLTQAGASGATWTFKYRNALQKILNQFIGIEKTPTSQRLGVLVEKLSEELPEEELKKVEQQVFSSLADFIRDIEKERGKLFDLLHELARELIKTESTFLTSLVRNDKNRRHIDAQFDEQVTGYVSEIENSLLEENSVNRLRELVMNRLGAIRQSIAHRREMEEGRTRELETRISSLQTNLEESYREISHIQRKAEEDHLTGTLNRKALDRIFTERLEEFQRSTSRTAFIMLDIDNFKKVNDDCGHLNGDKVLSAISARLKATVRKADYVFRYAGDEFAVILPDTNLDGALKVADLLRQVVANMEFLHKGTLIPITISLGVTLFKKRDQMEDVFQRADTALYEAKQEGRDAVIVMP